MAIVRYRPLFDLDADIRTLQTEMNRLFKSASPWENNFFIPAAELSQTDEAVIVKFELPGIQKADLNVEVTADSVKIQGDRKAELSSEDDDSKRTEFRYGRFERILGLPVKVKNTEVQATYENGILTLTLPKQINEVNKVYKVEL